MRVIGRFAESEDPVLYASHGEVDKCEFIKVNAPKEAWEAWSSTDDDGAGLLVKVGALREQAREVLVSAACNRTSTLPQPAICASMLASTLLNLALLILRRAAPTQMMPALHPSPLLPARPPARLLSPLS